MITNLDELKRRWDEDEVYNTNHLIHDLNGQSGTIEESLRTLERIVRGDLPSDQLPGKLLISQPNGTHSDYNRAVCAEILQVLAPAERSYESVLLWLAELASDKERHWTETADCVVAMKRYLGKIKDADLLRAIPHLVPLAVEQGFHYDRYAMLSVDLIGQIALKRNDEAVIPSLQKIGNESVYHNVRIQANFYVAELRRIK